MLVILVVLGVSTVVLLTWKLGWAKPAVLASEADAAADFLLDHPELQVEKTVLAKDGSGALLVLAGGEAGLIFSFGDKFVTRRLTPQMVRSANVQAQDNGVEVSLRLADFTTPTCRFVFDKKRFKKDIEALLNGLTENGKAA